MANSATMPFSRGIHHFAVTLASLTFVLIVAGAFVTSNDAGLAVPDWPTSFGSFYKVPPMTGGIKFEHGHRIFAEAIGLLTAILSFLVLRAAKLKKAAVQALAMTALFLGAVIPVGLAQQTTAHRALVDPGTALALSAIFGAGALLSAIILVARSFAQHWPTEAKIAILALPTVMLQGVLGGLTVLFYYLPWYVSTLHAAVAQTFFCLVILMALVTSATWKKNHRFPTPGRKDRIIRTHAFASIAVVYMQLILGAAFRHNGMSVKWHVLWAIVVTLLLLATGVRVLVEYSTVAALRRPAFALITMLLLQVILGFAAYWSRIDWSKDAVQPLISLVLSTVSHVAGGTILLAITWLLAAQVTHTLSGQKADVIEFRTQVVNA
jgi:heme a synthase